MDEYEDFVLDILKPISDENNVTINSKCSEWDEEDYTFLHNFDYWIKVTLDLPLSVIGVVINVFYLIILLSKEKLRGVLFNQV
jgi:hypothetical protein